MVAVLVISGLPIVGLMTAAPAGAVTTCPSAPYGVSRSAPATAAKTVALTFDDGPGRDTARILTILSANHVAATFFNLGGNESRSTTLVRTEHNYGFALGDHTWDHASLPGLSASAQATEMDRERVEQSSITGAYPCLFRPPYGSYNTSTLVLAQRRGMRVWNWSVDTEDWKAAGSASSYWVDRIRSRAEAGGSQAHPVILMHNQPAGNPATVAALPAIISYYRARGYAFVDLLGHGATPAVSSVVSNSGPTAGGVRVRVTGHGFTGVRSVLFGGTRGYAVQVTSPTTLYVTSPPHLAGTVNLRVTTTFGTSPAIIADAFHYVPPPEITGLSRHGGPTTGGVRVTVTGTNFSSVSSVAFGTVPGTGVLVASPTSLSVTAPPHYAGPLGIRVTTRYGYSPARIADHFIYVSRPVVSAVAPASGPLGGGTVVTVTGSAFGSVTGVTFGGVPASSVSVTSPTTLTAVAPAHPAGSADVEVTTLYGATSAAVPADRYAYVAPPAITAVTPGAGPVDGGTAVTVTGSDFTAATVVDFGGTLGVGVVVNSATELTVVSPPGVAGAVEVRVSTEFGTSDAGSFTYS